VAAYAGALQGKPVRFESGYGLPAVVYGFWEPFVAWGTIAALVYVFRTRFNRPSNFWRRWGASACGAYIVHAPMVVGLSVLFSDWQGLAVFKRLMIGLAATIFSFLIAEGLRRWPGFRTVL
jgi:ABC-type Co2+ transport system permease subunit